MSLNFSSYTNLCIFSVISKTNINFSTPNTLTINPSANGNRYGCQGTFTGTITGGVAATTQQIIDGLTDLNTLIANIKTIRDTQTNIPLDLAANSATIVTPGFYILTTTTSYYEFPVGYTLTCNGSGTYIFYNNGNRNNKLYGTVILSGGAQVSDIYWYCRSDTFDIYNSGIQGICVEDSLGQSVLRLNDGATLTGCLYSAETFLFGNGTNVEGSGTLSHTLNSITLCYLKGTQILTDKGYLPIEQLSEGDLVVSFGDIIDNEEVQFYSQPILTPIKWIQKYSPTFKNSDSYPIKFQKHSIKTDCPHKDLYVSPGHRMIIDGKMCLAKDLVNGISIVQEEMEDIEYYHFETEKAMVIDAQGAHSETFFNINYPWRNQPSLPLSTSSLAVSV
jgi:hypothetical protein